MARVLADLESEIRALAASERKLLLKSLISEIDAPADPDANRVWLVESERRLAEIEAGSAKTFPGDAVIREARSLLK